MKMGRGRAIALFDKLGCKGDRSFSKLAILRLTYLLPVNFQALELGFSRLDYL